jgi:hypothetical protein
MAHQPLNSTKQVRVASDVVFGLNGPEQNSEKHYKDVFCILRKIARFKLVCLMELYYLYFGGTLLTSN